MAEPDGRDDPLLPEQTADDTDDGWGEAADEGELTRYLRETPPHHGE